MKKQWWQKIFVPVIGEVMFNPILNQAKLEVDYLLSQVKLKPRSKILDLACGFGRHSIPMAKKKFQVVGFDLTKNYLETAKASAKKQKVSVDFVQGDMKELKSHFDENEFDLVVSLFNSFGYFDRRADDMKMLKEISRVLKPGGRLVLNTLNGSGVRMQLSTRSRRGYEPMKNVFMLDSGVLEPSKKRVKAQWTVIDARKPKVSIHRTSFQQNVYTHKELTTMLKTAGFKIEKTWGLLHGTPFVEKKSWHQTIVAKKR